jgi:hypothetical protein
VSSAAPRTCSDCGQELTDLSQPCPNCGSDRQTAHVGLSETVVAVDIIAELTGVFGPDRSWVEKWLSVRKQLERVESACTTSGYKGIDDVKQAFESFFIECDNLAEWLWQDNATGLSKTAVNNYRYGDRDLRICNGAAVVAKHHTRGDPNAMTARIASVGARPTGVEATLDWAEGSNSGTEDALKLARRSVASWERFLKSKGLSSPI